MTEPPASAAGVPVPGSAGRLRDILLHPVVVCCALSIFSIARQGFQFGAGNNVFHVPIVLDFAAMEQFAGDPFVQALRHYVTPLFRMLSGILDESSIELGFRILHAGTRLLTLAALYMMIRVFGATGRAEAAAALAILVLASPAYGYSAIGGHGLLVWDFAHTDLAQAIALFALVAMMLGRLVPAGWLTGLAGFLNLFVGAWMLLPLAWRMAATLRSVAAAPQALRPIVLSGLGVAVLMAPILVWVLLAPRTPVEFDHRAFLASFVGSHFFLDWRNTLALAQIGAILLTAAALAVLVLPAAGRRAALFGLGSLGAVLAIGVVLGEVATSRMLLNLHLLRADGPLTLLALAVIASAIVQFAARGGGPSVLLSLAMPAALMRVAWSPWLLPLGAAAMLAARAWERRLRIGRVREGLALALLVLAAAWAHAGGWVDSAQPSRLAAGAVPRDADLIGAFPARPQWAETKDWIRANTPVRAVILAPTGLYDLPVGTRRRTWIDWKQGSGAMWAPEIHAVWRQRMDEVAALDTPEAMLGYARRNAIDYVVIDKRSMPVTDGLRPLFENRWFAVLRAD